MWQIVAFQDSKYKIEKTLSLYDHFDITNIAKEPRQDPNR